MSKHENVPYPGPSEPAKLGPEIQALLAGLTAAIQSTRPSPPQPNPLAIAAAAEYAEIKAALRTHAAPLSRSTTQS